LVIGIGLSPAAAANGLLVSQESVARTSLTVRGTVAQFQTLFKTQLNTHRVSDGQTFYSASIEPTIPAEIASKISEVIGLTSGKPLAQLTKLANVLGEDPQVRSTNMRTDSAGGTGPGGTYSCTDLRTVYGIPTWGNLETGIIVAVFEQGSYRRTNAGGILNAQAQPGTPPGPVYIATPSPQAFRSIGRP
jgi:subtilase family serine protease